jgi:hypothetical protein
MLQMFYLDVAKIDLDVAYTCILQAYVLSVFRYFIRMFASVSSGRCIYLQWFLNVFQEFLQVFQTLVLSVFICLLLYVATVASRCFKNRSGVARRMRVGSGRRRRRCLGQRGRRPRQRGPTADALPCNPDALYARLHPLCGSVRALASLIK